MNRLKELRNSKNLTLAALAEELSKGTETTMNSMQLSRYERGENSPKAETWEHIANYFDVSVPYLMGYEENMTADGLDSWLEKSIEKMADGLKEKFKVVQEQGEDKYQMYMDLIEKDSQENLVKNQLQLLIERYKATGEFHVFEKWKELISIYEHEHTESKWLEIKSLMEFIQYYHGKISASTMKELMEFHQTMFEVQRDLSDFGDSEIESLIHHYASLLRIKERS